VDPAVADESDGNDDVDRMDDMVADIGFLRPQKKKCMMAPM
jgi:hypothetical protein